MSARRGGRYGARGERGPQGPKHRAEEEYVPPEHLVLTWQEEKLLEERFEAGRGETPPEPRPGSYADFLEQELEAAYQAERRRQLAEEIWREREEKEKERAMIQAADKWLVNTGQATVSEVESTVSGEEESTLLITISNPPRDEEQRSVEDQGARTLKEPVEVSSVELVSRAAEKEEGELESESEEREESERAKRELEEMLEKEERRRKEEERKRGAISKRPSNSNNRKRKEANPRRQWTMDDYVSIVDSPRPSREVSPQHPRPSSLTRRTPAAGERPRTRERSRSRGRQLPVKTRGAIFGGLVEIPTNPRIDPPPHTCYNCWQPGHVRGQCTREVRHSFCYNCGRRGESLNSCPRCSKAREVLLKERERQEKETRRRSILRTPGSHERSRSRGGSRSSSGRRVRWESLSPPRTSARQSRGRERPPEAGSERLQEVIHLAEQIRTLPRDLQEALLRMANPDDSSRASTRRRSREEK